MSKTDLQLKHDVEDELEWDPRVNDARIRVGVQNGVVSLAGKVDTYPEKLAAAVAAKRIGGVRSVVEDLIVRIPESHKRNDAEIAQAARAALEWHVWVPDTVTLTVHEGGITLEGQVEWKYQRDSAESAVRHLTGVTSVNNTITIKPRATAVLVRETVQDALQRQVSTDAKSIHVTTLGSTVTLTGDASSWRAAEAAAAAAWAAPGVTEVVDNVRVAVF